MFGIAVINPSITTTEKETIVVAKDEINLSIKENKVSIILVLNDYFYKIHNQHNLRLLE